MKKYLLSVFVCLVPLLASGQAETTMKLNYLPALSLGETAEFTHNFSPRGIELEVNRFLNEGLSLGLSASWHVFREKVVGESIEYNDALVTGTQFRYTNIVPLNLTAKKHFPMGELWPYVGLGFGTSYARQENQMGIFSISNDKWQFNVAPEAGLRIGTGSGFTLTMKIKYSYSFESGDFPGMSFLGMGVGIGIL